jgi:arylsulfatase A-like enzyme
MLAVLSSLLLIGAGFRQVPPNVVVVVIDTLRADEVGRQDLAERTTPNIDRLASEGITFTQTMAQAPWTVPSITSMFTSRYPSEHGQGAHRISGGVLPRPLAEILAANGYRTAAFTEMDANPDEAPWNFLRRGFQEYAVAVTDRLLSPARNGAEVTFGRAIDWVRSHSRSPYFLFVHTYEVHDYYINKPYQRAFAERMVPDYRGSYREWAVRDPKSDVSRVHINAMLKANDQDIAFIRNLYRAAISSVDLLVGRLADELSRSNQSTILIITSDHGEGFSPQQGRVYHTGRLHNDLLRIPLVINWRGHLRPARTDEMVQSIDILPTILNATAVHQNVLLRGRPLIEADHDWRSWFGRNQFHLAPRSERSAFAEESWLHFTPSGWERGSYHQFSIVSHGYKLIHGPSQNEVYDLRSDPVETRNLADARPDVTRGLFGDLRRTVQEIGRTNPVPEAQTVEILKSLGYIKQ